MAEETTAKAAQASQAAMVAEALRQSQANPHGIPAEGPTDRVRACAAAIAKGQGVVAAMTAAGYGRKFIEGNAAGFPAFLESKGLLTAAQARKATGEVLAGGGA